MIYLTHRTWKNYTTNNTVVPEWIKNTSVSGCPGLVNYVTEGIVILSEDDYEFETESGKITHWNVNSEECISSHYFSQANIYKPNQTIVKFNSFLMIKHDEEFRLSTLVADYDPLDSKIKVITATFPVLDIWTPVLINTVFPDGHHVVKKGDPIARLIISHAGNFEYVDGGLTKYGPEMKPWMDLKAKGNTLSTFNKEIKKCPFHR